MRSGVRRLSLAESFEDARKKLRRDAEAAIANDNFGRRTRTAQRNLNATASWSELNGVRKQVPDDLLQASRIGRDETNWFTVNLYLDFLRAGGGANDLDSCFDHRERIDRPLFQVKLSTNDSRHIHQVFDQLRLRLGVALNR